MKTLQERLKAKHACREALEWLGDKDIQEAWDTCLRADWMLWAYAKRCPEKKQALFLAKGHCVNTVRHLMKDPRSIAAVDAAIAYGEGMITEEELGKAYADADAAAAAATAVYDAADAADAAATAAYDAVATVATAATVATVAYAVAAVYAAYAAAAAAAVYAAVYTDAAYDAAYDAARKKALADMADICRKYLVMPTE